VIVSVGFLTTCLYIESLSVYTHRSRWHISCVFMRVTPSLC